MKFNVLYFARYREALKCDCEQVTGDFATVESLREYLILLGGHDVLKEPGLMCAVNEALCKLDTTLVEGDEVAFFPTVTGG